MCRLRHSCQGCLNGMSLVSNCPLDREVYGLICRKFRCSPLSGCGNTITTAQIWPWAASHQSSDWPWLHNRSTSHFSAKRGDYLPAQLFGNLLKTRFHIFGPALNALFIKFHSQAQINTMSCVITPREIFVIEATKVIAKRCPNIFG